MDGPIPGLTDIITKIATGGNLVDMLLMSAVGWFALRFARSEADREAERNEATKRIDEATKRLIEANTTIIRLVESSNKSDEGVAVALAKLEVLISATKSYKSGN